MCKGVSSMSLTCAGTPIFGGDCSGLTNVGDCTSYYMCSWKDEVCVPQTHLACSDFPFTNCATDPAQNISGCYVSEGIGITEGLHNAVEPVMQTFYGALPAIIGILGVVSISLWGVRWIFSTFHHGGGRR
jgi:hypothetical protein